MGIGLTVGSICTGYGGLELALDHAGIDHHLAWCSEIDPHASKVIEQRFPAVPNIGDINHAQPEPVDVITAGFPCFAEGTVVTTKRGLVPIETVRVGDLVLTHLGRWMPVVSTMRKENAPTREIAATGVPGTVTTDEHPYYVSKQGRVWNNSKRSYDRTFGEPEWLDASDLKTCHRLAQILPPVDKTLQGDEAFWYLVGRYLADGWRVKRNKTGAGKAAVNLGRVVICCAHEEADGLDARIEAAGFNSSRVVDVTATKFHIVDSGFYRFLEQFGKKAHGKTLPGWVLGLDPKRAESMLSGYLDGDGSDYSSGQQANTVSRCLAIGIAALAHRARNVVCGVTRFERPKITQIQDRSVNQRDTYDIRIPTNPRRTFIDETGIGWRLVTKNKPTGRKQTVFNISVKEDESYVADGAIVHNCQDISTAGHRAGLDGERSGLWWRIAEVVSDLEPRFVVLENVSAITSLGGPAVIGTLTELGYDCRWGVVRASDTGAPHRRARWFCVAYHTDSVARSTTKQFRDRNSEQQQRNRSRTGEGLDRPSTNSDSQPARRYSRTTFRAETPREDEPTQSNSDRPRNGYEASADTSIARPQRTSPKKSPGWGRPGPTDNRFGHFGPAVQRWEYHLGRPAPNPTVDNRLNPAFVEWLMGLPEGWVTELGALDVDPRPDRLSRAQMLRILGNGVVPQQAALAFKLLGWTA